MLDIRLGSPTNTMVRNPVAPPPLELPQDGVIYNLCAVVNHVGTLGGGHYTCHAKHGQEWFTFNDSRVYRVKEEDVISPSAYVLVYQRKVCTAYTTSLLPACLSFT